MHCFGDKVADEPTLMVRMPLSSAACMGCVVQDAVAMHSQTADGVGSSMFCVCCLHGRKGKPYTTAQCTEFGTIQSRLQIRARSKRMHLTIYCGRPAGRLHLFDDNDLQILRLLAAPGVSLPADEPPWKALL